MKYVMWGQQYSRRPRTRGAARAAPKGAHGLEEPKEAGGAAVLKAIK